MLAHSNLNLILWDKLTSAQQLFYWEAHAVKLGVNTDIDDTPEEMFSPNNDGTVTGNG